MNPGIPHETREAIILAWAEGAQLGAIARRLDVPYQKAARVLRRARAIGDARAARRWGVRGARAEQVLDLRAEGLSEAEIGARLGLHPGSAACMVWRARQLGDPRAAKLSRQQRADNRARILAAKAAGPQRPAADAVSASVSDPPALHASLTVAGGEHAAEVVRGVTQSVRGLAQSVRGRAQKAAAVHDG